LTYICNKSISAGIVPEHLKYSIIKPLYKKGDKTNASNYRPISLTSFPIVFEKALYIRLIEHINNNTILVGQQFGFRKRLAMEDAIFQLIHEILNALNNKVMVGSIFYDLIKGFHSVNHSLLIKKFPYYGITGKSKLLLKSCFLNRFQRVQLDNSIQYSNTVSNGLKKTWIPTGFSFGPLFVSFIC